MKIWIARIGLAVALISVGYLWGHWSVPEVRAQGSRQIVVPKSAGHYVGSNMDFFFFEDSAGTIRGFNYDMGSQVITLTRQ